MTRVLIITDHRTHSAIESIYPLSRAITRDPRAESVACISRGEERSWQDFMNGDDFKARSVNDSFRSPEQLQGNALDTTLRMTDIDVVFMRMDRPFNAQVASDLALRFGSVPSVNDLQGMLSTGRKSALPDVTERRPPMWFCTNREVLEEVLRDQPDAVVKHDETFGARGVYRKVGATMVSATGEQPLEAFIKAADFSAGGYVVVPFLPGVAKGDKRLLVAGGSLISATLRVPKPGGWLANLRCGATSHPANPTNAERQIVEECDAVLRQKGVFLYSIDTLEDDAGERVVSELNTLNVGILPFADGGNVEIECSLVAEAFLSRAEELLKCQSKPPSAAG